MGLNYDISEYIAKTKMSAKKRVLVEGRDDRSHFKNLLDFLVQGHSVKIDTAENIIGDCDHTRRNNRAKIDKIHDRCRSLTTHRNLHYLCDREFHLFDVDEKISDLMGNESIGNYTLTRGHSMENYFFTEEILCDAYRYLYGSEYKTDAISVFKNVLHAGLRSIVAITLAARDMGISGFPAGNIFWQHFIIEDRFVFFDIEAWVTEKDSELARNFRESYIKYIAIVDSSDPIVYSRVCRGHTAMLLLQRLFARCIYFVTYAHNEEQALRDANIFSQISEAKVAGALCESWVRLAKGGVALYPETLLERVA